ncbi:MAG: ABC transporter permease [Firmicutes bacterium]|nr:ABC transporter permease [Bacillota bacterium]
MWNRFKRHRAARFFSIVFIIIVLFSLGAGVFQRYPPNEINLGAMFVPPSAEHWLGTDSLGRDIWSRILHGGRVSLAVGVSSAVISALVGTALGAAAGYYGGTVDMVISRITDVAMTFPAFLVMLTIAAMVGPGLTKLILIIGLLSWPPATRLVRGQVLSLKSREFVVAARALGASDWLIITKHILPNVIPVLLAQITFQVGGAILTEAGLSFLGMGVPMPTPSWGNMLEPAKTLDVLQFRPWAWIPAAIMVLVTVLCINFIGDGIRDAIDTKLQM